MTVEEAIKTALEYENSVVDVYRHAEEQAPDAAGKRMFNVLVKEEQDHVDYLESRLEEWQKTGQVTVAGLATAVPPREQIEQGIEQLEQPLTPPDRSTELALLKQALDAELKTSGFYRKLVRELPPEGRELFARFVEIEEGHVAIVQAEIDALSGTGCWFDFQEFKMA